MNERNINPQHQRRQDAIITMHRTYPIEWLIALWDKFALLALELELLDEFAQAYRRIALKINDPDSINEPFTLLYARAVYDLAFEVQAMRRMMGLD